jgi:hypothetical protein
MHVVGIMPKNIQAKGMIHPDCDITSQSCLFLAPCVSQRTRNKVFLPREPYAERRGPQPPLVELALLRTGPKGQHRPVGLERSEEIRVVEGLEARVRACLGGSGDERVQIAVEGSQQRRGTRGKVTAEVERRFRH